LEGAGERVSETLVMLVVVRGSSFVVRGSHFAVRCG
jgi:hypothetical protein